MVRLLRAASPGSLWRVTARFVPQEARAALDAALKGSLRHERIHGEVYRWQLMRWSQVIALAFQLGVVSVFAVKVSVHDMAFAWSTQVEPIAERMPKIVSALSAPWARAWPEANPSPDFVTATRYARLRGGEFAQGAAPDAGTLGQWWPFLMACLLAYGVLPRIATWAYCAHRARRAAEWSVVRLPGADAVLQRLNQVQVQTAHAGAKGGARWSEDTGAMPSASRLPTAPHVFVNWSSAPEHPLPFAAVLEERMGGRNTPEEDDRAMARVTACVKSGKASGVVIGVRAWEAPTEALFDIVRALRAALDAGPVITLLPLTARGEADRTAQWAAHAARVGDPWLRVMGVGDEPGVLNAPSVS